MCSFHSNNEESYHQKLLSEVDIFNENSFIIFSLVLCVMIIMCIDRLNTSPFYVLVSNNQ